MKRKWLQTSFSAADPPSGTLERVILPSPKRRKAMEEKEVDQAVARVEKESSLDTIYISAADAKMVSNSLRELRDRFVCIEQEARYFRLVCPQGVSLCASSFDIANLPSPSEVPRGALEYNRPVELYLPDVRDVVAAARYLLGLKCLPQEMLHAQRILLLLCMGNTDRPGRITDAPPRPLGHDPTYGDIHYELYGSFVVDVRQIVY
jgi:hypothetical protein